MDMEKLTKQQIVLVTLLVSFVTSIATGIVTVALMDQAPAGVTQTINQIVERTIERVVTPPANTSNSAAVITKETIVVSVDDKISAAVDKNKNSIVRIYLNTSNAGDVAEKTFIGLGTIISKEGLIVTGDVFADQNGKYLVTQDNNKFYEVKVLSKKDGNELYFLRVIQDAKNSINFSPISLADSDSLKLGQTVITLSGQEQNSVSTGIISSLVNGSVVSATSSMTTTTATSSNSGINQIVAINANINITDSIPGSPLINLNGEVVGLRISSGISEKYNFLPSKVLKNEITDYATVQ